MAQGSEDENPWGWFPAVMIQGQSGFLQAGFRCIILHMTLRATRWGVLLSRSSAASLSRTSSL